MINLLIKIIANILNKDQDQLCMNKIKKDNHNLKKINKNNLKEKYQDLNKKRKD